MLHSTVKLTQKKKGALVVGLVLSVCIIGTAYINRASALDFGASEHCHFDYVTQGADWAENRQRAEECGWVCAEAEQSPVDIVPSKITPATLMTKEDKELRRLMIEGVGKQQWTLINNGHTIKFAKTEGASFVRFRGGIMDADYCLAQIHFHWPSEHTFEGNHAPLEAHFVSFRCDLGDLGSAVAAPGRNLAVMGLGMEMQETSDGTELLPLIDYIEEIRKPSTTATESFAFDPLELLMPVNNEEVIGSHSQPNGEDRVIVLEDFFAYDGSLTTPGCNQAVRWHVLKDYKLICKRAMDVFYHDDVMDDEGRLMVDNYRVTVPNSNPIYSVCSSAQANRDCSVVF